MAPLTANPAGSPRVTQRVHGAGRPTAPIQEPSPSVLTKQDPAHTEGDFLRDLDRATRRPDDPSSPDQGSSRT
jgi:hypothetical protein